MSQPPDLSRSEGSASGSVATLWRRAPWWRATIVTAALTSAAGVVCWSELDTQTPKRATTSVASSQHTEDHLRASTRSTAVPDTPSRSSAPVVNERPVVPTIPSALSDSLSQEDEQALASCHPHLLLAPPVMPQIDVNGVQQPDLAHIKIHFWVNGAGMVTRTLATEGTLGTPAEQQSETEYLRTMRFSVPNTADCRSREIELIGDIGERREATGAWASYARLYPRLSFGPNGDLVRRE